MDALGRAALTAAVCASAVAVGDAVVLGLTGDNLVDDDSVRWWSGVVDVVHAAAYALLAAGLVRAGAAADAGSRARRVLRRVVTAALVVLAICFAVGAVAGGAPALLEVPGGTAFLLLFLAGAVLGVTLLRVPGAGTAGALMAAPVLLLGLAVAAGALAPRWAHPGYAEAALYVGLALLGARRADAVVAGRGAATLRNPAAAP
ncbi:hypothetical protein [Kineococcus terrestris]|uniref:hypothetical protein n=1 Tax=Kineococcus terrestris TaxID=2044856 RepID=UPI0034DB636D